MERGTGGARLTGSPTGADQNGRSSSSASSASGASSNDLSPLTGPAPALAPAGTFDEKLSEPSPRPESRISSRALISVV
jgi:hypothetical protein